MGTRTELTCLPRVVSPMDEAVDPRRVHGGHNDETWLNAGGSRAR